MRNAFLAWLIVVMLPAAGAGVERDEDTLLTLRNLSREALDANPEIRAATQSVLAARGRLRQAGLLDAPELMYMREEMPGFRWQEAMKQRVGLYQMVRFPTKLTGQGDIAGVQEHQTYLLQREKENEILSRVRASLADLWGAQENVRLNAESERLLRQVAEIAASRIGVGRGTLEDALKTSVEISRTANRADILRQQEMSARAMLAALLNRPAGTLAGRAVLDTIPQVNLRADSLLEKALASRPLIMRDSLMMAEGDIMVAQASREYLPDLRLGLEYVTQPMTSFTGWTVVATLSLPIVPWSIGRAGGMAEEAEAWKRRSEADYEASRSMVSAAVRDLYYRCRSRLEQLRSYREQILPESRRSLQASITAYQAGTSDILMVLDAHRMFVDLSMEAIEARMSFEQSLAELERTVGTTLDYDTGR